MRALTGKRLEKELERLKLMRSYENQFPENVLICGIDEAGRGPLAGPVAAGAVILPRDCSILRINDSKKLSPACRDELYEEIREKAVSWSVGLADVEEIDRINILQATYRAMLRAVNGLDCVPGAYLNDAVTIPGLPSMLQTPIIGGDGKSISIAAASIMAKVTRDRIMETYDRQWPEYGFARHKGYGTKEHREAILRYGPCPIHRKTFLTKLLSGRDMHESGACPPRNHTDRPSSGKNQRAAGARYEAYAADWLASQGYQILARNFRWARGEIDIIAREKGTICFVEVKYRHHQGCGEPEEAVDRAKQKRIAEAARVWLADHGGEEQPCRFDVVAVTDDRISLIRDSFWV